jgi:hypothetical protein
MDILTEFGKINGYVRITLINSNQIEGILIEQNSEMAIVQTYTTKAYFLKSNIVTIEFEGIVNQNSNSEIQDHLGFGQNTADEISLYQDLIEINQESHSKELENLDLIISDHSEVGYVKFNYEDIPWKEDGLPPTEMFKGRTELINQLIKHYRSIERKKTYVLYGLTRTGKTSLLKYFSDKILNEDLTIDRKYKFIPFIWDLSRAANSSNAKDMWNYLLDYGTVDRIKKYVSNKSIKLTDDPILYQKEYRQKDLRNIIDYLKKNGYFPLFLIDEFTYYKVLFESHKIDQSFVANFRQLSYSNHACFVYAGTYNLKDLVSDKSMSISGQFANTIEEPVGPISKEDAYDLILAFKEFVKFDNETIQLICNYSNYTPYFIQIICKNLAFYCLENKRNNIDSIAFEKVVRILVGDEKPYKNSYIRKLSDGVFGNNQFDPTDKEGNALISSICYLSNLNDKLIGYEDIANLWVDKKIRNPNQILQSKIESLREKGIIQSVAPKNGIPHYKMSVELFKRWWNNKAPDIDLEIANLKVNN